MRLFKRRTWWPIEILGTQGGSEYIILLYWPRRVRQALYLSVRIPLVLGGRTLRVTIALGRPFGYLYLGYAYWGKGGSYKRRTWHLRTVNSYVVTPTQAESEFLEKW